MHLINQNIKGLMEIESSIFNIHEILALCSENDNQNFYKKYISYLKIALEVEKNKINSLSFDDADDLLISFNMIMQKDIDHIDVASSNDKYEMIYRRLIDLLSAKLVCDTVYSDNALEGDMDDDYCALINHKFFSIESGYNYLTNITEEIKKTKNSNLILFKYKYIFNNIYLEEYLLKNNSLEEKDSPKPSRIEIPYYEEFRGDSISAYTEVFKSRQQKAPNDKQKLYKTFLKSIASMNDKTEIKK